jgi:hypothetical protein
MIPSVRSADPPTRLDGPPPIVLPRRMLDARQFLATLVDKPLFTITDRNPNRVMRLEGDTVRVETDHSGVEGALVPILWVQEAIDALYEDASYGSARRSSVTSGQPSSAQPSASYPT